VIDVAMRGLPNAFRDVAAAPGDTVVIDVSGPSGGRWTLFREAPGWTLWRGEPAASTARIRLDADTAWQLLFNALRGEDAVRAVQIEGRTELGREVLRARSVIV
jgi:hypothetical protein